MHVYFIQAIPAAAMFTPLFTEGLVNLFVGLLLDLAVVGTLKVLVKRSRPHYNKGPHSCHCVPYFNNLSDFFFFECTYVYMFTHFHVHFPLDQLYFFSECTYIFTFAHLHMHFSLDDMFATVSVDKYSFPSGHSTRASYLATLAYFVVEFNFLFTTAVLWAVIVALSRVVLGIVSPSHIISYY